MNIHQEQEFRFATRLRDGRLLVSDQTSNSVLIADKIGNFGERSIWNGLFNKPQDLAVDPETGNLFVVDRYNNCFHVFTPCQTQFKHHRIFGADKLNQPVGIAIQGTEVYIADNENHRIAVFDKDTGDLIRIIGDGYGQKPGQMFCPCGVAVYKGLVIVAEWGNGRLQIFRDGKSAFMVTDIPHAHHVAVDSAGGVYVAQYSAKRVRKFKIYSYDDRENFGFATDNSFVQLDAAPCGVFCDGDKMGVVTKTSVVYPLTS
jgi:DNA-binding beta-propeller fold protein YncE